MNVDNLLYCPSALGFFLKQQIIMLTKGYMHNEYCFWFNEKKSYFHHFLDQFGIMKLVLSFCPSLSNIHALFLAWNNLNHLAERRRKQLKSHWLKLLTT